jgi:hypothetical protein
MTEQLTALDAARKALAEAARTAQTVGDPRAYPADRAHAERNAHLLLESASVSAQIAAAEAQIASANALTAALDLLLEIRQALEAIAGIRDTPSEHS